MPLTEQVWYFGLNSLISMSDTTSTYVFNLDSVISKYYTRLFTLCPVFAIDKHGTGTTTTNEFKEYNMYER